MYIHIHMHICAGMKYLHSRMSTVCLHTRLYIFIHIYMHLRDFYVANIVSCIVYNHAHVQSSLYIYTHAHLRTRTHGMHACVHARL